MLPWAVVLLVVLLTGLLLIGLGCGVRYVGRALVDWVMRCE
jgi:hypothetical protein